MRIIGASILNLIILQAFVQYIQANTTASTSTITTIFLTSWQEFGLFFLVALFIILFPLISSLAFTERRQEIEKIKIVPPFFISIIGAGYLVILLINSGTIALNSVFAFGSLFIFIYAISGNGQDRIGSAIFGRASERELVYFTKFDVEADIEDVKNRIRIPEIRRQFNFGMKIEGDSGTGYTIVTPRGFDFITKMRLIKDKDKPNNTIVKVAFYEKGRYSLRTSALFVENTKLLSNYLYDVFVDRTPKFETTIKTALTNSAHDELIDSVIDDMRGLYVRSQEFGIGDWIKVGSFVLIVILTIYLFIEGLTLYGGLTIVLDALLGITELPDVFRKRRA